MVGEVGGQPLVRTPDGLEIRLARGARVSPGPVALSVRPERIRLDRVPDPLTSDGVYGARTMGKITDRIFAGGVVEYRVAVNGRHLLVHAGNDGMDVRAGDEVALTWMPDDAHVVQEDRS